jgi:hypothetical protein
MKTNRILTLLSVCGLFAGSATIVANYHNHESRRDGSCSTGTCGKSHCHTCRKSCGSCPTGHTYSSSCEEKPVCERMVPVHTPPCKQCNTETTCSYTCPTEYYKAGTCKEAESKSRVAVADQDEDGKRYTTPSAAAAVAVDEETLPVEETKSSETKSSKHSTRSSRMNKNK